MDKIDTMILRCLRNNARQSATDISKEVNLSVAAVTERIHRLENSGIIKQYTVLLEQKKMGNDVMAFMEVRLEHPKYYPEFTKVVTNTPEVVWCNYVTGDYDFLLQIHTKSAQQLEELHRMVKSINGVCNTKTSFILKEIKNIVSVIPKVE